MNPLYGDRLVIGEGTVVTPKCFICPAGGVCLGGDQVVYPCLFVKKKIVCILPVLIVLRVLTRRHNPW